MLPVSDGNYDYTRKCFGSFLGGIIPNTTTDDPVRVWGTHWHHFPRTGRLIFAYRPRLIETDLCLGDGIKPAKSP
jgi:hypothetical protein